MNTVVSMGIAVLISSTLPSARQFLFYFQSKPCPCIGLNTKD